MYNLSYCRENSALTDIHFVVVLLLSIPKNYKNLRPVQLDLTLAAYDALARILCD